MFLTILGNHPELSLAELESLVGAKALSVFSTDTALLDVETTPDIARLGGTMKIAEVIETLASTNWREISRQLPEIVGKYINQDSKIQLGISVYGNVGARQILASALEVKKHLKSQGHSVRIAPNKDSVLSAASVMHNKLLNSGYEIVVSIGKKNSVIARTVAVQDVDAYAERDHGRPMRDARVGMLPPKLAQIMISLAQPESNNATVYDPFCGTGVVLQEALMQGLQASGSDLESRMIEYTRENLAWLSDKYGVSSPLSLKVADSRAVKLPAKNVSIISETYLGPTFSREPNQGDLAEAMKTVDSLLYKSFCNFSEQLMSGTRHCIAVPTWYVDNRLNHLPLIDQISSLGYNLTTFASIDSNKLIYRRPQSVVGRQLLVLTRQ